MTEDALELADLAAFVELAERRSIQGAARAAGASRATYQRRLERVRAALLPEHATAQLLRRAPGQRVGVLTPEGELLAARARVMLAYWDRWRVATRDALAGLGSALRVGTLPGSFDLIADILTALRREEPELAMQVIEYPDERLIEALRAGEVDLGFSTAEAARAPKGLTFRALGPLPWAVILPAGTGRKYAAKMRLAELDGVPLVVTRAGPARERLEREFAHYASGPLVLNAAFQVGSTPRVVEMVARGFGPAIVSRFRVAFLPAGVEVRPLVDGPAPLTAGVFTRTGTRPSPAARRLLAAAQARFADLAA